MQAWNGGYPKTSRYLDTIQTGTAPLILDVSLMTAGRALPHQDGKYRYAELGCGTAFSMIALAAANPQSEFVGYDFMPEHVVRAQSMIEEAGLTNVSIYEASFEELACGPVPAAFDYISLHGVWSWVSEENQRYLTQILGTWLAPGGVAYVGYAAMAGWARITPIRRMFQEAPQGPPGNQYGPAREAVDALVKLPGQEQLAELWDKYRELPDDYLAHDFGAQSASACWNKDIVAALDPAKLEYVCPVNLFEQFEPLCFDDAQLAFLGRAGEQGWVESARDLALGRSFRADIFTRGAPLLPSAETWRRLGQMNIAPWVALLAGDDRPMTGAPERPLDPQIAAQIAVAFQKGIQTVDDFITALNVPEKQALQLALLLVAKTEARMVRTQAETDAARETVKGFHTMLARRWRDGTRYPGVSSPRLGAPFQLSRKEQEVVFDGADCDENTAAGLARLELPKV